MQSNPSTSPNGVYSQGNIKIGGAEVEYIDVVFDRTLPFDGFQKYKLDLEGCVLLMNGECSPFEGWKNMTFDDGRFIPYPTGTNENQGSMFIPRGSESPDSFINKNIKIHWCPTENYFLVSIFKHMLLPLRQQTSVFASVSP